MKLKGQETISGMRGRLVAGFGANVVGKGVSVVAQLVGVPLILSSWGAGMYGEWLFLSSITAYFTLTDLGFTTVAANEMTINVAAGDRDSALKVFQSTWVLVSGVSLGVALVGLLALWQLPIHNWLGGISSIDTSTISLILSGLLLHILVGLQLGLVAAGYRCAGFYARGQLLSGGVVLADILALVIVLMVGGGPVSLTAAYLIVRTGGLALLRWDLRHRVPWIRYGFSSARRETVRRLARPAIAFSAIPLGHTLSNSGMILVVGLTLGPIAVVVVSVIRTAVNLIFQLVNTVNTAVWPELSIAFGAGELGVARKLHRFTCRLAIWIGLTTAIGLFWLGERLIEVWTAGGIELDVVFFRMMLAVMVVKVFWLTSSITPTAVNRHEGLAIRFLAWTTVALLLTFWLAPFWGLPAVVAALLVADVQMLVFVVPLSLRLVEDHLSGFAASLFLPRVIQPKGGAQ